MKKSKLVFFISIMSILILSACSGESQKDRFELYKTSWEEKDYEAMYDLLSQESKDYIGKDEFIDRYETIYKGIGAKDITISIEDTKKDHIIFNLRMESLAGEILEDNYQAKMVKEKQNSKESWFIDWDESLIFPQMEKDDEVRVSISKARRGEIYDKSGNGLAINGSRYEIGIHPAKYDQSNNPTLAELLDIDEEVIKDKLEDNLNPEHFVPIAKLATDEDSLLLKLTSIDGVIYQEVEDRIYPGGEATGSLIGYITPITAERLEEDEDNVYTSTSLVGRFGLEEVFEESLRAIDGKEIYISKIEDGKEVEQISLAKIEPQDGKDLNTTIDIDLQKDIYKNLDGDLGASTAIDPKTGEVLALVSSPSFDPNLYTSYIPNSQREEWQELEDMDINVFENKFNKAYSPGSTFKLLTAAIGLETDTIDPNEKINIQGKGWQKDRSWGSYEVNRVNPDISNVDLNDALVYSDNIYFARQALEIGEDRFLSEAEKFGFNEDLPIDFPMASSQILANDRFENEILLADTGYGQGQVLMTPLHTSLVYSSLVNNGDIMKPSLNKDKEPEVWKEKVISDTSRSLLLDSFIRVIEDKNGTGHDARINNLRLAGKTGTAELKLTKGDTDQENGWFVAMDVDDPEIVISMFIEAVEDKGGSSYVLPKVKKVLENYLGN